MKTVRGLADRMLERLVPQETASACAGYWIYRCVGGSCSSYSNYTQRVWSCDFNRREFMSCGC
ncbi:hypothetical protein AB0C52_20025 [Streptomyces sp. NPDC048717]|uniref:hypothetical protein n=1 Tax=Streptomyces sp. NPDC048717 TaxID=3154928 RepID=UPI00343ACCD4